MSLSTSETNSVLRFARIYAAETLPWFAPALFKCKIHLTEKVEIAAIDYSFNIYFNPKVIAKIADGSEKIDVLSQLGFLWIHEISHPLREHNIRSEAINAESNLWNIAADLEINDSQWKGLKMPEAFPGLLPSVYKLPNGKIAEWYYRQIAARTKNEEPLPIMHLQSIDEGSGAHGHARPWEVDARERQEMDEVEIEAVRISVAREIKQNIRAGKLPGNMAGGWLRWAEEKLESKTDWRKVLRHRMSIAMNMGLGQRIDYTFNRPSRRQSVYHPILPPTLSGDLSARIAIVVDTSGSMSPQQLGQAVGEACKVLETFQVPVTVIPCDAKAYEPIQIAKPSDYFKLQKLQGGGGTNMIAGIEATLRLKPAPDAVLVLTDGYTPYPQKLYKTRVVFGIFKMQPMQHLSMPPDPPYGKDTVVVIPMY